MSELLPIIEVRMCDMKNTTLYKIVIAIIILVFWWYCSEALKANSTLTLAIIPIPLGLLTVIAIVIQLVLRESIQSKMKEALDSEIEERKEDLLERARALTANTDSAGYTPIFCSSMNGGNILRS